MATLMQASTQWANRPDDERFTSLDDLLAHDTSGAPDRFIEEVKPALIQMADSSTHNIEEAIASARQKKIDDVDEFLAKRFTAGQVRGIQIAHATEEQRPIETIWDAVTGVTAYAKSITWQDQRVDIEREAGKLLKLAA